MFSLFDWCDILLLHNIVYCTVSSQHNQDYNCYLSQICYGRSIHHRRSIMYLFEFQTFSMFHNKKFLII